MNDTLQAIAAGFAGVAIEHLAIDSANPINFHQAIRTPQRCTPVTIEALLVLPEQQQRVPVVMIVPGSAGLSPNHVAHGHLLHAAGYGVCLVDPFGPRSVTSTVANQTQYSFAASAYDVLATLRVLAAHRRVDGQRIVAQGHSRGGSAVLMAAMRPLADAVVGDLSLAGVYAAYPWCGQQFTRPVVGRTQVRAIFGDRDDWGSLIALQAQIQAISLTGGVASMRIVPGAEHSFDRHEAVHELPEARVSPHAPIEYLADDGSMIDPYTGEADPDRVDLDQFRAAAAAGFARKGAHLGSSGDDQPELFCADMVAFHRAVLGV